MLVVYVFFSTPPYHKTKFAPRVVACVLLGYPHGKKSYKLLNFKTMRTFISRDVVFHEEFFPFATINSSLSSNPTLPTANFYPTYVPILELTPVTPSSHASNTPLASLVSTLLIASPISSPLPSTHHTSNCTSETSISIT